ncbi:Tensin-3 [Sparganum proliferum]
MSNSTSPDRRFTSETSDFVSGDRARFHFSRRSGHKLSLSPGTSLDQGDRNETPKTPTNVQPGTDESKRPDQALPRSTNEFIPGPNNGQRSPAVPLFSQPIDLRNQVASSPRSTLHHPLLDSRPAPPSRLDSRLYHSMRVSDSRHSSASQRSRPALSPVAGTTSRVVSRTMDASTSQNGNSRSDWQQSRQVIQETSYSANQTTTGAGTRYHALAPTQTPSQSGSTAASAGSHLVSIEIPISPSNIRARASRESPALVTSSPVSHLSYTSSVRPTNEDPRDVLVRRPMGVDGGGGGGGGGGGLLPARTTPLTQTYKKPPVVHDDGRYIVSNEEEVTETVSEAGTTTVVKRTVTRRKSKSRPSTPVGVSQREENSFAQSLRSQSRMEASTASTLISSRKPSHTPLGSPSRDRFNGRPVPEPSRLPANTPHHMSSADAAPRKPDIPATADYDRYSNLKELLDYERSRMFNRSSPVIHPSASADFAPSKPTMPGVRQMNAPHNQRSSLGYNRDRGFAGSVLSDRNTSTSGIQTRPVRPASLSQIRVPIRTVSQTNVHNYSNNLRNNWISEHNLRDIKQPPVYSTYSARRENMRLKEQNQTRTSSRHLVGGVGEIVHETISLQPIGPGIHDLETPTTPATLPRVIGGRSNSYSGDMASAYRHPKLSPTLPRTSGKSATERRSRHESTSHWRSTTEPAYHPPESSLGSIGGASLIAQESHMNHVTDSFDNRSAIYHAQETSNVWLMPNISKEEAQSMLLSREPGTFLVRTSKSRQNFYVLVLRVPASLDGGEPLRSFLIEHSQMRSGRGDGYHLHGFQTEPVYPTLAAFVHDHTTNRGALPICLKLPSVGTSYAEGYLHSSTSTGTRQGTKTMVNRSGTGDFNCDVLFLGNSDVFPLENAAAVRRAVEQILINAKNPSKGLKKKCEALVSISPDKTLTIVDKTGLRFQKKTIAGNRIRFCGYDPEERVFNSAELRNRGVVDAQIFAIVVKKTRFAMTEHVVYVMCQLDAHQPSSWLVNYINRNVMGQHR